MTPIFSAAPPTIIDLLRHGEPVGGEMYRGSRDDPLSALGWEQLRRAVARDAWEVVASSPLLRCAEFARELAAQRGLPLEILPELREMGFGEWEGHAKEELLATDRDRLIDFWRDPLNCQPPGGEHLSQVAERVASAWEGLLTRHAGRRILIVAHGGIIRVILGQSLGLGLEHLSRLLVPYAGRSRIRVDQLGDTVIPRLVFHGMVATESL